MDHLLRYYVQIFKIEIAVQFQYRVSLLIWMLDLVLRPIILLIVWQTTAGEGSIAGYDARGFAAYYFLIMLSSHFNNVWDMWEVEYYVRNGSLSGLLLRPYHVIHKHIAGNITFKILMLVILIPALTIFALLFQPRFDAPVWALLAFVPTMLLGAALTFISGWLVAVAIFWTTRMNAIINFYFLAFTFFSGEIAPIDVLPPILQNIAAALPFRWMMAFPVEVALGRHTPDQVLLGIGLQLVWVISLALLFAQLWRWAIRRYSAVGG